MNYVYRYIDTKDNIVKYIGIVCRDGRNALEKRIYEHKMSDSWCQGKSWRVEYITVATKNDANALESHFISLYETHRWFNQKKIDQGILSYYKEDTKWITFIDNLTIEQREIKRHKNCDVVISIENLLDVFAENMGEISSSISIIDNMLNKKDYSMFSKEQLIADREVLMQGMKEYLDFFDKKEVMLA